MATTRSSIWMDMPTARRLISRHLSGRGVELGPGSHPIPLEFPGAEVAFVDRWVPEENRSLFPELGDEAPFPRPDIVANLDVDRLKPLDDQSQDFVIASHLLEHLADPLRILDEIHRVLKPGGTTLILLPDRRFTFDAGREPTSLDHLVAEFEAQVTEVDDAHIVEFVQATDSPEAFARFEALGEAERREAIERHRRRSIHAHCWSEEEFPAVLLYAVEHLGHEWDFVDGLLSEDEGPAGYEFGYVLRRVRLPALDPAARRQRFDETWTAWETERREVHEVHRRLTAAAASAAPLTWKATLADLGRRAARRIR